MPPTGRLRHLTTVVGSFHGRVVAARLGAEGILVHLKGLDEGPYRIQGMVEVFVQADQLDLAREILLADAVDDVFDEIASEVAARGGSSELAAGAGEPGEADAEDGCDLDFALSEDQLGRDALSETAPVDLSGYVGPGQGAEERPHVHRAVAVIAVAMVAVLVVATIVAAAH